MTGSLRRVSVWVRLRDAVRPPRVRRQPLRSRLACAVRGHGWESMPTASGTVVVMCGRCRELVVAGFVDEPEVLGLVVDGARSGVISGDATAGRVATAAVLAVLNGDPVLWRVVRREAVARPGASVDALASVGASLALSAVRGGHVAAAALVDAIAMEHDLGVVLRGVDGAEGVGS